MSSDLSTECFGPVICPLCKTNTMVLESERGESESWKCEPCHFVLSNRCVVAVPVETVEAAKACELVERECFGCNNVIETSQDDPYPLCEECSSTVSAGGELPKWVM